MRILFVCTGNICRSPMAEGIARAWIENSRPGLSDSIELSSAGVSGLDGRQATQEAIAAMRRRGIDISSHRARSLGRNMVGESDLLLVMEESQLLLVERLQAQPTTPAFLLLELALTAKKALEEGVLPAGAPYTSLERLVELASGPGEPRAARPESGPLEVFDPVGMPLEVYIRCASLMDEPVTDILEAILGGADMESE